MTKIHTDKEALIAEYLAGQAVEAELLQACHEDDKLADVLAGHLEVERLLLLNAAMENGELFVKEVTTRLQCEGDETFVGAVAQQIQQSQKISVFRWVKYAAAALVVLSLSGWFLSPRQPAQRAIVAQQRSAVWEGGAYNTGDAVRKGDLTLREGYAELTLAHGVRLILESPLTIDVTDPKRVILKSGSLVATVPRPAIGFTVITPSSEVVDLGTEFGVSVDKQGGSEVCVLKGEVKARGSSAQGFVKMVKNEACSFDPARQMKMIQSDPARYLRALPGRSNSNSEYLHWSFDCEDVTAVCVGTGIQGKLYDGQLKALNNGEGPLFQEGVFGNALYFNGKDAFVETGFPGIGGTAPRTVAFWTKVPEGDIDHS